ELICPHGDVHIATSEEMTMPADVMFRPGTQMSLLALQQPPMKVVHFDPRILEPPPAPRQPETARGPSLYIIEEYALVTVPGDFGVTRNVVSTMTIPGRARQTLFFKTTQSQTQSGTISETALESQDKSVADNMSHAMSSSAQQSQSKDQSNFKFDGSFHGEV